MPTTVLDRPYGTEPSLTVSRKLTLFVMHVAEGKPLVTEHYAPLSLPLPVIRQGIARPIDVEDGLLEAVQRAMHFDFRIQRDRDRVNLYVFHIADEGGRYHPRLRWGSFAMAAIAEPYSFDGTRPTAWAMLGRLLED